MWPFVLISFALLTVHLPAWTAALTPAAAKAASERTVKAAFLYKFLSYVEWPDGTFATDAPIVIAILGDDPFADEFTRLVSGRDIDGRPLRVIKHRLDDLPVDTHVVFFTGQDAVSRLRSQGKLSRPVLIITEAEGALSLGSAINFVVSGGRVKFEVNVTAAEKRGIRLSSRLLSVAQNIR